MILANNIIHLKNFKFGNLKPIYGLYKQIFIYVVL